jgi:hypothetical protein
LVARRRQNAGEAPLVVEGMEQTYGSLRVNLSKTSAEIEAIVNDAEQESLTTCEACGGEGRLREDREWIETLCDVHA